MNDCIVKSINKSFRMLVGVPCELGALSTWPWKAADLNILQKRLLSDHVETHGFSSATIFFLELVSWSTLTRNVSGDFGDCHCRGRSLYFSGVLMSLRIKPPSAGSVAHRHVYRFLPPPFWAVLICHRLKLLLTHLYWRDAAALFMLLW